MQNLQYCDFYFINIVMQKKKKNTFDKVYLLKI